MTPDPPATDDGAVLLVPCELSARHARVLAMLLRELSRGRFRELAGLWLRQETPRWSDPALPLFLGDLADVLERRAGPRPAPSRARLPRGPLPEVRPPT